MEMTRHVNFWPWTCGLTVTAAMTCGLAADGFADTLAAILLVVPSVVVTRHLIASNKRRG